MDPKSRTKALREFQRAVALNPRSPLAHYFIGFEQTPFSIVDLAFGVDSVARETMEERGITSYSRSIQVDSRFVPAYLGRANCYLHLKRYSSAIADYSRVLELDPTNAMAVNDRALTYMAVKDYRSAIRDFETALGYKTKTGLEYAFSLAFEYKGDAQVAISEDGAAIVSYSQAIKCQLTHLIARLGLDQLRRLYPEYDRRSNRELARIVHQMFDPDSTEDAVLSRLGMSDGTIPSPGFLDSLYEKRGDAYLRSSQFNLGIRDFKRIFYGMAKAAKPVDRWRPLGDGGEGKHHFLDVKASNISEGAFVRLWIKTVNRNDANSVYQVEIDCKMHSLRQGSTTNYGKDGAVTNTSELATAWQAITPDTFGEKLYEGACSATRRP